MSETMPVTSLALVRARTGRADALGNRLRVLLEPARRTPGCLRYELERVPDDPDLWRVRGLWASEEAMTAHLAMPVVQVFADILMDRSVSQVELCSFPCRADDLEWEGAA
ncbi:putative quinol monooxygenase [Pseudomonas indica]|uniref:Quinol monooxygenase YgiN n=1 Tax=Pseudomonas indica TaxID=137658 RepID=A0A1G9CYE2_9PSED|nr:putative quinol monooxygenase [Pseudomonas indica]SDK56424.1 Quinol monooxygenase YgiN [Pseudomonas indica]